MAPMWWWSTSEDGRAAGGWDFDGSVNPTRELMVIHRVRRYSIWLRPALTIRVYDDGRVTLAEGEWRPL